MSNIGKHLFEVRGYLSYRGEVIKETDKSWTVRKTPWTFSGSARAVDARAMKSPQDVLVDADIDPRAAEAAYRAAMEANEPAVKDAREELRVAGERQRNAAIAALKSAKDSR